MIVNQYIEMFVGSKIIFCVRILAGGCSCCYHIVTECCQQSTVLVVASLSGEKNKEWLCSQYIPSMLYCPNACYLALAMSMFPG